MANEFSRKESALDYQIYQGREHTQVNWNQMSRGINETFNKIAEDREARKKEIDDETDAVLNQLEKADAYNSKTLGDQVNMLATQMREQVTTLNGIVKRGGMKPAEFLQFIQKAKDNIANWGIASKDWDASFVKATERQQLGEDGVKIASATETFIKDELQSFGNLNNVVPWVSPKGNVYSVRMIDDGNGNQIMPDYDTHPENYLPYSSINNKINYEDNGNKYDVKTLVANNVDDIGTFITSYIEDYTLLEGGGAVVTTEGARQMNSILKDENGEAYQAFDTLRESIVDSIVLTDGLGAVGDSQIPNVANIIEQHGIKGKDGNLYKFAQSEEQFRQLYPNSSIDNFIKVDVGTTPPTYTYTEDMIEAARDYVRLQVESQVGYKREKAGFKTGQQENASSAAQTEKLDIIGGEAGQIADILTADQANATAIMQTLISDLNTDVEGGAAGRITNFDIQPTTIDIFRDGMPPVSIERAAQSTQDVNQDGVVDSKDKDPVSLLNEITSLYKTLTGKDATRVQIEKALEQQGYDLDVLKKSGIVVSGKGTQEAISADYTDSTKIDAEGKTLFDLVKDELGGGGPGSETGLGGIFTTDTTDRNQLATIFRKAMKKSLKTNLAKLFPDEKVKMTLISDEKADAAVLEYVKDRLPSGATSEQIAAETNRLFPNRDGDDEVIMIRIAGKNTIFQLDNDNYTNSDVTNEIARILNEAANRVNTVRASSGRLSAMEIRAANPRREGESRQEYNQRMKKLFTDQNN